MIIRIQSAFEQLYPDIAGVPEGYHVAELPEEVTTWLEDLLLLRGIPLSYIVPDPRLLPPESIRLFHLDPTWTARLFDGVLAAASFGAFDTPIHAPIVRALRLRAELGLAMRLFPGENDKTIRLPMLSGLLFRSEIVRRWPGLTVSAWEDTSKKRPLVVARKERIAAGLMIVIFAGIPTRVEIAEPPEGTRFGVEPKDGGTFSVQIRHRDGSFLTDSGGIAVPVEVRLRDPSTRVLDLDALATDAAIKLVPGVGPPAPLGSGQLSLCLQQQPFVQVFQGSGPVERKRIRRIRRDLRAAKKKVGG